MPIERDLRGRRFFITGATGFLGTALVERILRCVPEAEITLLVRPGRRADAAARVAREVIKNDCFDRLRHELGDEFAGEVGRRVQAVAGDVGRDGLGLDEDGREALRKAGVVIHSAATVSFDAPLTQAVEINLLGPSRVAAAMTDTQSTGHLISVSTAYVASTHQGEAKEELLSENRFTLDVPWEDEVAFTRRLRDDLQAESRKPDKLKDFTKKARTEIGAAGDHLIAARAEKVREEWVSDELVRAGTARALSLGWPDAYPFTKALGERALVEQWEGKVPITFVRPSIIESALAEPRRAGSGASAWRSRSSSPTPTDCCASSPAFPRASSTSSRSTWWWPPSWPSPPAGPSRDGRRCTTSPPACGTPCATAAWSSSPPASSSATPSTTTGASPSACPSGPTPGTGACSASSAAPTRP